MDIYNQINESDLNGDMKLISAVCGIESTRKLLRELGGIQIYIPKLTRLDEFMWDYISSNSEKTKKEIAGELKVSEQHIRNLIKRMKNGK